MTNKLGKPMGAPRMWESMAGFLPAFIAGMGAMLIGMFLLKAYLG